MRSAEIGNRVVPSLLAGTGRQPLSLEGTALRAAGPLAALSLAGQWLRFERPATPSEFAQEASVADGRRILPEPLRRPLLSLLRGRRLSEDVELALAWSFERLGLRPHPFDLPRMGSFARSYAEQLGPAVQLWASRESAGGATPLASSFFFSAEELDETNWTAAQPARRLTFVMNRRRSDAIAGLNLVRSVWANEEADMRVRLLGALAADLKASDRDFLEELKKDRAPRVRDLAQRLLGRLPGAVGSHPALDAALERIEKTTAGLLRQKTVLKLQFPATVKEHQAKLWIRETFAEVSCAELARALNLDEAAMIEAAARNADLLLAIAWMATADRRLDLFELAIGRLPEAWEKMAQCGPVQLEGWSRADRTRWAEMLIGPYAAKPVFSLGVWMWMHRALEGPLPASVLQSVVLSAHWREKLAESKGPEWMELLAACCPAGQRPALRTLLNEFEPAQTACALALLDVLDGLEKGGANE